MRYSLQPKFYSHPTRVSTPLQVQYTLGTVQKKKAIGMSIPIAAWDSKNRKVKKSMLGWPPMEAMRVQNDLHRFEALFNEARVSALQRNAELTEAEFLKVIDRFKKGAVAGEEAKPAKKKQKNLLQYLEAFIPTALTRRNKHAKNDQERITKATLQQHTQLLPTLQNFHYWTGRSMSFRKIDIAWHDAFLEWGQNVELLGPATLGKHIKTLKRVCYYAKRDGLDVCPDVMNDEDFDKPRQPKHEVQYLNRDELQSIEALDLAENPQLEIYRDWLIIGCWTGLRVSDLGRLSMEIGNGFPAPK